MSVYRIEKKGEKRYIVYKDDYLLDKDFTAYREATYWVYAQGACPACGVTLVDFRCDCPRKEEQTYSPTERAAEKAAAREVDENKSPEELELADDASTGAPNEVAP